MQGSNTPTTGRQANWRPGVPLITSRNAFILAGVLVALMVAGSLWDYPVSLELYNPTNVVGIFGAAFGELPLGMALLTSGTLLIVYRNRERKAAGIGQAVGGCLLYVLGAGSIIYLPTRYLAWPIIIVLIIGAAIVVATTLGILKVTDNTDRKVVVRVALILFIVPLVELILVNIVKIGWERPRMRFLAETDAVGFHSWWDPGTPEKAGLVESGIASEEFKSFPSGHTANAANLILLTVLVPLRTNLEKYSGLFLWIGAVWGIFIGFTRIIAGAHFITDTVVGFTITFIVILIAYRIAFPPASSNPPDLAAGEATTKHQVRKDDAK
ncbi:phosphatase PAP2 family protein [Actinomyces minihominis]|uniref:phosphatase PAP2 family protein n=1 Tax=Actinomyces minihominis TaxID=2002838 RepID=UPI000C082597|nr:phosphatase PAP2 family protein [Actinomyces minihominis]